MWKIYLFGYLSVINIIAFVLYGIDKRKAKHHAWRITEKTLILCSVLGGGIGSLLGMMVFHHKTKHMKFRICVPLFTMIWIGILVCIYLYIGR